MLVYGWPQRSTGRCSMPIEDIACSSSVVEAAGLARAYHFPGRIRDRRRRQRRSEADGGVSDEPRAELSGIGVLEHVIDERIPIEIGDADDVPARVGGT